MKLSIVMPCYNEEKTIRTIVDAVLGSPVEEKEIIIVDDCSTDETRLVLNNDIKPMVDKIIFHDTKAAKGVRHDNLFAEQAAKGAGTRVKSCVLYKKQDLTRVSVTLVPAPPRVRPMVGSG